MGITWSRQTIKLKQTNGTVLVLYSTELKKIALWTKKI